MKQLRRPRLDRPGGRHALPLAAWHELGRARAVILIENTSCSRVERVLLSYIGSSTALRTLFQTHSGLAIFEMTTQDRYPVPEPTQILHTSVSIS